MSMQTYHDLKDMLCRELDEITRKGELTAGSLDTVDKLTHSIKSLETIIAMNEAQDGESGYYPHMGGYRSYTGGRNNDRRGMSNAQRRDSRGRYSGDDYSREDARDDFIADLREVVMNAPDEHMKKRGNAFIRELQNA